MERNKLALQLELVGEMLEIDGMNELFEKFQAGISTVKFNAVVIQTGALLMKERPDTADKLIAMARDITTEEVEKLDDGEYGNALKQAITQEVIGFFASSQRTDGKK